MASGFGKIVVGTYVEIKRSDGKFHPVYSFHCASCWRIFVAAVKTATVVPAAAERNVHVSYRKTLKLAAVRAECFKRARAFQ